MATKYNVAIYFLTILGREDCGLSACEEGQSEEDAERESYYVGQVAENLIKNNKVFGNIVEAQNYSNYLNDTICKTEDIGDLTAPAFFLAAISEGETPMEEYFVKNIW